MRPNTDGRWIHSKPYTWSASGALPVDTSFLDEASSFKHPEIEELWVRIEGTATVADGDADTFNGKDVCKVLDSILVTDRMGPRVDLRGFELSLVNQVEWGDRAKFPLSLSIGAGQSFEAILRVPCHLARARRRRDTTLHATDIRDGGSIQLRGCAAAVETDVTITAATFTIWCLIREGDPELKSRLVYKSVPINNTEDTYTIGGSLRWAVAMTPDMDDDEFASVTAVTSHTLQMVEVPKSLLVERYVQENSPYLNQDIIVNGGAFPVVTPKRDQKIDPLADLRTLHLKFNAALPADSRLVLCLVTDREPAMSARALGFPTPEALGQAIESVGRVKSANGNRRPASAWSSRQRRRLPLRVG